MRSVYFDLQHFDQDEGDGEDRGRGLHVGSVASLFVRGVLGPFYSRLPYGCSLIVVAGAYSYFKVIASCDMSFQQGLLSGWFQS